MFWIIVLQLLYLGMNSRHLNYTLNQTVEGYFYLEHLNFKDNNFSKIEITVEISSMPILSKNALFVVLVVNNSDIQSCICPSLTSDALQSICPNTSLYYDNEATFSNQQIHLLEIKKEDPLIVYIGYLREVNTTFNFSLTSYYNDNLDECLNDCNLIKPKMMLNTCQNHNCQCKGDQFGKYCQFQKNPNNLSVPQLVNVKEMSWYYLSFDLLHLMPNQQLKMKLDNIQSDFYFGFGLGNQLPSLYKDIYFIDFSKFENQIFVVQQYIDDLLQKCTLNCGELLIGFYNKNTFPTTFRVQLYFQEVEKKENYQFIIAISIVVGIFFLILALFLYCCWKQTNTYLQETPNRRPRRRRKKKNLEGFNMDFIMEYFPGFFYESLVQKYPSLHEINQCVICLETMKPGREQQGIPTAIDDIILFKEKAVDYSITKRTKLVFYLVQRKKGELFICSVTPCFHLFHTRCLYAWLSNQKNCPLCRQEFSEKEIKHGKPWVIINDDLQSFRNQVSIRQGANNYVKRMKTRLVEKHTIRTNNSSSKSDLLTRQESDLSKTVQFNFYSRQESQ